MRAATERGSVTRPAGRRPSGNLAPVTRPTSEEDPMDAGIAARHARGCRHRESRCTCSPTFKAQVWDARVGKRMTKTFPTITAARRWRQDAYAALRSGTLTADTGPTLAEATEEWLDAARA